MTDLVAKANAKLQKAKEKAVKIEDDLAQAKANIRLAVQAVKEAARAAKTKAKSASKAVTKIAKTVKTVETKASATTVKPQNAEKSKEKRQK